MTLQRPRICKEEKDFQGSRPYAEFWITEALMAAIVS